MSAVEIIEIIRTLSQAEQREIADWIENELGASDDELTPEQITELDRRAEDALKNPERGISADEIFAKIEQRFGKEE